MPAAADQVLSQIEKHRKTLQVLIERRNSLVSAHTPIASISGWFSANSQKISDEHKANERWYALFVNLAQILFVLPILAVAVVWHRRNTRQTSGAEVGTLVSSHLVYIAAIPIIFKIIEFLNDIIPYQLLGKLFKWVWDAGLQYLWSYAMILIGIGIIFLMGRWILSHSKKTKAKTYIKCLEAGLCPNTGRRLPPGCRFSPYTGEPLMRDEDGKESYRYAPFSSQTGKPNPEWDDLIK